MTLLKMNFPKVPSREHVLYFHINSLLLLCLSNNLFISEELAILVNCTLSIKMTFFSHDSAWTILGFLLGLYLVNKAYWTLWAHVGCVSQKSIKHGGQDDVHEMEPGTYTCQWGPGGFLTVLLFHMPEQQEREASLLTNSIIMQIWHQGISTGHQNLNGPSPLLRLPTCNLEPAPLSSDH